MTVAELHTTPELAWLDAVEAGMGIPRHDTVGADVARSGLARIARVRAQLAADESRLIRIVDDAELAKQSGSTSTSSMLSKDFGGDQAAGRVRCARPRTSRWRP